jgi:hypothetical protein
MLRREQLRYGGKEVLFRRPSSGVDLYGKRHRVAPQFGSIVDGSCRILPVEHDTDRIPSLGCCTVMFRLATFVRAMWSEAPSLPSRGTPGESVRAT